MAITYYLHVQTTLHPREVLLALLGNDVEVVEQYPGTLWRVDGEHLICWAYHPSRDSLEIMQEYLELTPDVSILFRLGRDTVAAMHIIAAACLGWLHQRQGDTAFLFQNEQVIFLRLHDQLRLNKKSGFWNEQRLSRMTLPYTWHEFEII